MRNLKKILALVLALVMSLSLMAVASADDELNLGDVSETYAESVDVLTGLKVFMGNKGEFLPKDNITRAEVAAIIYRIVTGDVTDAQKGIYADYNKFSDVTSDAWYAGYVNYCANAEYVKGVGYDANGKAMFKPQQNVTGYEALAMILRAIGYDRNNEFTGPSWQIQTAATARNRGILKNIAEGTLGGAATREAVAEILCQTILVPVADYSLAFGYRTTDANGKDNETLAYKTFKMEKIDGVVMANEQASLTAATPLPAGQTTLGERTLNVTSTLDDIGESRYVYVRPAAGTNRYDLVTTKTYDTGLNQVYDNEGAKVASVGNSTGSANGITSIAGAQHFINFEEIQEYTAAWRLEYVLQVKMSQYDAYTMYYENGSEDNSSLILLNDQGKPADPQPDPITSKIQANTTVIDRPETSEYEAREANWSRIVTDNTSSANPNGFTYEYRKVINAGEKLNPTDINNIRAIFTSANYAGSSYIQGEVYGGTNTSNTNITINGNIITSTADLSDRMNYEQFVENYLKGTDNKRQVTSSGLGQHLKIVDNNNDGVAEYVLQTIYTVAIINANGGLDIANVEFSHNNGRDDVNQVISTTPVVNDGEGELATGNVVIYALIDGNARAQLAATETVKINTVNRAATTATATGENGKTWTESDVHTHSSNMNSGVTGMVGNTTYTLYFDLYGNLAAYTEGDNGAFVLITDGWYRNALNGGEYAVRAYIDGSLKTVELTAGGNLFVNNSINGTWSSNNWGMLKTVAGLNCSNTSTTGHNDNVHTFVANLDGSVITPVDKMYNYIKTVRVLDVENNVVPGSGLANARIRDTNYQVGTAYVDGSTAAYNARVSALSNTIYYYVFNSTTGSNTNTVVRTFTGYGSTPTINANYIEDVYVVGTRANAATGYDYYTADVVVVELNADYDGSAHRTGEPVFVPDFSELTGNLGTENVRMIRSSTGEEATLLVNMGKSNLAWYDVTGENNNANNTVTRVAGLYYLSEDATNPGTYILDKMTAEQIRGESCILSGYVNRSTATQINNYATIDLMSVDKTQNAPEGEIVATNKRNVDNRAKLTENSKYYTLAYNSSRIADLKVSDAATVLAQVMRLNPNDNTPALLNEQVDGYSNTTNLNEVMMFVSGGNIVAAISFNEYRNFANVTRDYAQTVWANCLPSLNEDQGVKFYGVEDNKAGDLDADAKDITVSYADAAASFARGEDIVSVNGTNIQSWTLREVTDGVDNLKRLENTSADKRVDPATRKTGAHYILTVNYYVGGSDEYDLVMQAANTTATLVEKNPVAADVTPANGGPVLGADGKIDLSKKGSPNGTAVAVTDMLCREFVSLFKVMNGSVPAATAKVEWTWTTKGLTQLIGTVNVATDGSLSLSQNDPNYGETMANIGSVNIVVVAEDGTRTVYSTAGATNVLTAKQNALAAAAAKYEAKIAAMAEGAQKAAAQAAYDALVQAIKDAANLSAVEAIYNNGSFVTGNETVDKVEDIVIKGKATVLPEAVNGVVTLTQDVELAEKVVVNAGETVTVNLNGNDITAASRAFNVNGGELVLTGEGKISLTEKGKQAIWLLGTGGKVSVGEGVTIESQNAEGNSGAYALAVWSSVEDAEIDLAGKLLGGNGITVNGDVTGNVTLNIASTAVIDVADTGLYLAGPATTNIAEASITGGKTGIEIRAGVLNVHGATIRGNGTFVSPIPGNPNGSTTVGAGIAVSQHTTNKNITVTVDQDTKIYAQKQITMARPQGGTDGVLSVSVTNCPNIVVGSCVMFTDDTFVVNGSEVTKTVVSAPDGDNDGGDGGAGE